MEIIGQVCLIDYALRSLGPTGEEMRRYLRFGVNATEEYNLRGMSSEITFSNNWPWPRVDRIYGIKIVVDML